MFSIICKSGRGTQAVLRKSTKRIKVRPCEVNSKDLVLEYHGNHLSFDFSESSKANWLRLTSLSDVRPMTLSQNTMDSEIIINLPAKEKFSMSYASNSIYTIHCQPYYWILALDQNFLNHKILHSSNSNNKLIGQVFQKIEEDAQIEYSLAYFIFAILQDKSIPEIVVVRPDGAKEFEGILKKGTSNYSFSIHALPRANASAISFRGKFTETGIIDFVGLSAQEAMPRKDVAAFAEHNFSTDEWLKQ